MLKLKNVLSAYDRVDTTEVDCGNGWTCEIRSMKSKIKELARLQSQVRAKGGIKPKKTQSAQYAEIGTLAFAVSDDDNPYFLGTFEADVDFMVSHLLVGWKNLKDDDGNEVPYTPENARSLFLDNRPSSEELFREFMTVSMDDKNFVRTASQQAEEDGKN